MSDVLSSDPRPVELSDDDPGQASKDDASNKTAGAKRRSSPRARGDGRTRERSDRRIEAVLDLLPLPILMIEPGTGRVLFANQAVAHLSGGALPANGDGAAALSFSVDGKPISDDQSPLLRAARGERLADVHLEWHTPAGSRSVVLRSETLPTLDDQPAAVLVSLREAPEIKPRPELSNRLGKLLDESSNEIYIFDATSLRFLQVSQGAYRNLGYTMEELATLTPLDLDPEFNAEQFAALIEPLRANEQSQIVFETVHRRKDGSLYPVEVHLQLSHSEEPPVFVAMIEDITERKRTENVLRESEERFRLMADSAPVLLWVSDTQGLCTFFNQRWLDFTGRTLEQESGNGWTDDVHLDDYARCLDTYWSAFNARQPFTSEYRLRRADGVYRWVIDRGVPRYLPDGSFAGFIGSCIDITDRRELEEALKQKTIEQEALLNTVPALAFYKDRNSVYVVANRAFAEFTATPIEAIAGKTDFDFFPPEQAELYRKLDQQVISAGTSILNAEEPVTYRDGTTGWVATSKSPYRDQNGEIRGIVGISMDITSRKTAEEALARQTAILQEQAQLLDLAYGGVMVADFTTGLIKLWNRGAEQLYGWSKAEACGQHIHTLLQTVFPVPLEEIKATLVRQGHWEGELVHAKRDGSRIIAASRWALQRDEHDRPSAILEITNDITAQKRAADAQRFLAEAGTLLTSSLDYEHTLARLARLVVPTLADWCAINVRAADGTIRQLAATHRDPARVHLMREVEQRYPTDPFGYRGVLRSGEPKFTPHVTDALLQTIAHDADHADLLRAVGLTAQIVVPLVARGRVLGAINLALAEPGRHYDATDLALAEDLARRAAIAVDNALLYMAEQQARRTAEQAVNRTARLLEITVAFSQALTPTQVARVIIDQGLATLGASAAFITLLNDDGTEHEVVSAEGFPEEQAREWHRFSSDAAVPLAEAVRTRQPIWIGSSEERVSRYPHLATEYQNNRHQAWVSIPLLVDTRPVGGLALSFSELRPLNDDDRNFILALAGQCALALERARLYAAEQALRQAAEQAADRTARLQAVTASLAEALTPEEVTQVVVEQGIGALGATAGSVVLLSSDGAELELVRAVGYPGELLAQWRRFPIDSPVPLAEAVRTGRPNWHMIRDGQTDTGVNIAFSRGTRTIASIPFLIEGRVVGALGLSFDRARAFSDDERSFMLTLAAQCAQALARARLYDAERQARAKAEAAERAEQESHVLLDTLFATAPVGLAFFDHELRYVRINEALAAINGMPAEAHIGRRITEVLPELSATLIGDLQHVLNTGEAIVDREVMGETPSAPGEQRYWLTSYYPVRRWPSEPLGVGSVVTDISERKRAEEAQRFLAEASALLASSLDYEATLRQVARLVVPRMADWCAVDMLEDGAIRRLEVAHVDPTKVALAHELQRRYPPNPDSPQGVAKVLRTGRSELISDISDMVIEAIVTDPDLLQIIRDLGLRSSMTVPLVARGRAIGAISFVAAESGRRFDGEDLALAEDLARRAALAVDNARLYREAQEAILARDDFLSIASHELKTPLTSLQLQAQSLLRMTQRGRLADVPPDRLVGKLELMDQQAGRLTRLANDLLDVARIRAARIDFRLEEFDVVEVVRDVLARSEEQIALAGCAVSLDADTPAIVHSDRSRLDQIVTNLLSNAIKYGQGKPIEVGVSVDADAVRLIVRDYGIGIAPEHLERIFVRFERAVSSRNYGGLGLGLYIVRQIVEALGGSIQVTSEPGAGATFVVALPRTRSLR